MGPRCFGTMGLAVEALGHHLLAGACEEQHQQLLPLAYGLVGTGGNMLMLASVHFSELFEHSCTAAAVLSGAYQFAAFVFTLLTYVTFHSFFQAYQGLCLVGLLAVFASYPDKPYKAGEAPRCERPRPTCQTASLGTCPRGTRCMLFLLAFSWAATCSSDCPRLLNIGR